MVENTLQAITGLCLLSAEIEAPAWVDGQSGPDPVGILVMRNGLLDLAAAADGRADCLLPPNPAFFTLNAAPFDYTPDAPEPTQFIKFLDQLWPDDPQSIATLQEWFGLMLTPDTTYQKIMLMVGAPRSGKGTIARVLTSLVGARNVCGPTLTGLANEFGLSILLGKSVAILSDVRLGGKVDSATVTERLLAISGEDTVTANRKNRDQVTVKFPTRFMMISNELPKLGDASGALPSRLILLRLARSFLGKEDKALTAKLTGELPGILKWAIAGWKRLRDRGHFQQPESGKGLMGDLADLSSPVGQFVRERCALGDPAKHAIPTATLYGEWKSWCEAKGKQPGIEPVFGRELAAAFPELKKARPRCPGDPTGKARIPTYEGIRLRTKDDPDPDEAGRGTGRGTGAAPGAAETLEKLGTGAAGAAIPDSYAYAREEHLPSESCGDIGAHCPGAAPAAPAAPARPRPLTFADIDDIWPDV